MVVVNAVGHGFDSVSTAVVLTSFAWQQGEWFFLDHVCEVCPVRSSRPSAVLMCCDLKRHVFHAFCTPSFGISTGGGSSKCFPRVSYKSVLQ